MNKILDNIGTLNIEELIINQPSFIKIMSDGIVTEEELIEQSEEVTETIRQIESCCNEEQIDLIRKLLAEISVLVAINQTHNKQFHNL